ncbi:PBECR3 domain-containing polyvalent protein [Fusobacterium polymorphum]|uniref:PBECR3 domain-containing polyvalent protein n=1 Tax=Fusobacterium nucleatum subsp. polymorphum TaxID=76857 RepID=UPI00300974B1
MENEIELIGLLKKEIIEYFNLNDERVFIGEVNKNHIRVKHYEDYEAYFEYISEIISSPDYFGKNLRDESIELIKEFKISEKIYIKVAVRISKKGKLFARTLYKLTDTERFEYQLSKGFYKKIKKS